MGKRVVNDTSLVSVADAIRAKGGTSDALAFPDGFVDAIEAIETGGGSSDADEAMIRGLIEKTIIDFVAPSYVTNISPDLFRNSKTLASVTLHSEVIKIGSSAFNMCTNLKGVDLAEGLKVIDASGFNSCYALESIVLPSALEDIGASAFMECRALKEITIPEGVLTVRGTTFSGCSSLKTVTFLGKPNQFIPSTNFTMFNAKCTSLTDIYVPWAEGEVANAPWGAPETVTIHYNYIGGEDA